LKEGRDVFERRRISLLLLSLAAALVCARAAHACSCGPEPTVLDSFEHSDVVIVARAISVEKTEKAAPPGRMSDGTNYVDGVMSTTMRVERVYKGRLKAGDEMTFAQGGGADCVWTFDEKSVGERYLFYLKSLPGLKRLWVASTCGRSNAFDYATDDLLYLDKLDKVRGKTRVSGRVDFDNDDAMSVAGRTLRIMGGGETREVKTDAHGVYEIYDLPPGTYYVEPELPGGWKLDVFWLMYSPSVAGGAGRTERPDRNAPPKRIPILLQPGRHASLDVHFEIDDAVAGRVFDPGGRPLDDVCVHAVPPDPNEKSGYHADCTTGGGKFQITELPPGNYILVINSTGGVSSTEPFKTFYYPNVTERERAGVFHVGAGDHLKGFDIYAPYAEATVTIEGVLLYSDGKPVADESVEFKAEKSPEGVDGDAHANTDARGRFRLKVLKGLRGEVNGEMMVYSGEFENCPKLEALIRKSGEHMPEMRTPALKFQADADTFDVELKFPFPWCKKERIE
jgi:hypothetical protein